MLIIKLQLEKRIFWICQILERKSEYNGTAHQLFTDFKKAYDSAREEVLYNIHDTV
jgi:hypothetical protein